ncbi:hypothetical protein [Sphingobacterium sp. LRF_L2]|uniref:hypothetical protein n=1 Tax=Sphingobacterium sp. LRF_L2 TaxID=3369421 RepID=UPI003F648123
MATIAHILVFSICKNLILRRKEIMEYLKRHIDDLELISIDLADHRFTMSLKTDDRSEELILNLVKLKGLQVRFVSSQFVDQSG